MIGKRIKNLREHQGATLVEVAEKMGTSQAYLSQIENNIKPPSDAKVEQILTLGFGLDTEEAKKTVDKWRIEERLERGNITIGELSVSGGQLNQVTGDNATIAANSSNDTLEILKMIKELNDAGIPIDQIFEAIKKS